MTVTVSVVTVVYNNVNTVCDAVESVLGQDYHNVEYIIIDGGSTDGTLDVLSQYRADIDRLISEPDDGIYDAMNKGIRSACGDVVGILNSDDFYADAQVLSKVAQTFKREATDCVYGDLIYIHPDNEEKILRYWKAGTFSPLRFHFGWMPPHPTVFMKRRLYEQYGLFRPELTNSADYELLLRMLYRYKASAAYIPQVLVHMRAGGHSNASFAHRLRAHFQDYRAWILNGYVPNPLALSMKPLSKLPQYFVFRSRHGSKESDRALNQQ